MSTCAVLSFRLRGTDGVSIVADTWIDALQRGGFEIRTVAGAGPVDVLIPDLAIGRWPDGAPGLHGAGGATDTEIDHLTADLVAALSGADLVVVENLGSIPMNLPASIAVARARQGLPTIWHHHDPAWQRGRYADVAELPPREQTESGQWRHVIRDDPYFHPATSQSMNSYAKSSLTEASRRLPSVTVSMSTPRWATELVNEHGTTFPTMNS